MKKLLPKGIVTRKNKDGTVRYYRRQVWRDEAGKQKVQYHLLPAPDAPGFATKLARTNEKVDSPVHVRGVVKPGSISALIRDFKPVLAAMPSKKTGGPLAGNTMKSWNYFLALIDAEHGDRMAADFETHHFVKIRNGMVATPGKANNYLAKFKGLMKHAADTGFGGVKFNAAAGVDLLPIGEFEPWPPEVIDEFLAKVNPVFRLAIISALYSGQRISDIIRMEHSWHDGRLMRMHRTEQKSKKTKTAATIPMHPVWLAEIAKVRALAAERKVTAMTLLFDALGKPFGSTGVIQNQMNYWMKKLGHVDANGSPLYSFHGLSKNAICGLAEMSLTDEQISAIVGKTVETVRYYSKETRKWMIAEAAADTVIHGNFGGVRSE